MNNEEIQTAEFNTEKRRRGIFRIFPIPAFCLLCLAFVSLVIHIISYISTPFANYFNENISAVSRSIFAHITGIFPFSLGEFIVICLPIILIVLLVFFVRHLIDDSERSTRFLASIFSIVTLLYSLFVFNYGTGYRNSRLDVKMGIEKHAVTAQQLYDTLTALIEDQSAVLDKIYFPSTSSSSLMPFDHDEMCEKINAAYKTVRKDYTFISDLHSTIKCISLSKPLTYTHISGIYTYYTGESNLNVNFPDYTLVYTTAHEFAHQRGIAREDEANFVAFLVCTASEDPYIRYCGYQNMTEYLLNALYSADKGLYEQAASQLSVKSKIEISAFNAFFAKYEKSVASTVSSAVNNTFLHSQGVSEGERSYGMVVDLCVAYYENMSKTIGEA